MYGGLQPEMVDLMRTNTEDVELSFNGCLRIMRMNNQRLGGAHKAFALYQCSDNVERGVFFGSTKNSNIKAAHAIIRE